MFERFTDRSRRVVVLAQEEARLLNHDYIGTEHLLLGLIHEGEGVAATVLTRSGLSLDDLRQSVETAIGVGDHAPSGHIPFTPRAKKVLELSLREALQLQHNYIGTEHILLGLVREGQGVAARVLTEHGVRLEEIRRAVLEETRLHRAERAGAAAGPFAGGPSTASFVSRLERIQQSLDRIERRLDAMNAPPDPGIHETDPGESGLGGSRSAQPGAGTAAEHPDVPPDDEDGKRRAEG